MSDYATEIAEAFTRHWNFRERTDAQCRIGHRLAQMGYPIHVKPGVPQEAELTVPPAPLRRAKRLQEYVWSPVESSRHETLTQQMSPADGKYTITANAAISQTALDWWPEWRLLEVVDSEWANPRLHLYYLQSPDLNLFRLNGVSPPIHEANALTHLQLSPDTVLSYLVFFCFFVRGAEGPFHCIETLEDPLIEEVMSVDESSAALYPARIAIEGTIRPLTLEEIDEQGRYICNGSIYYSNAIFIAHFAVEPGGMAHMLDDEPVAADLPYKIDSPIT